MSESNYQNNSNILYELTEKNYQIEHLINENNQYSQLVYNLQSEIFSLKSKLTNFNELTMQVKNLEEKNEELEKTIKNLSSEILDITKKNKEENRKTEMKFYMDLKKAKFESDGYKSKIDMTNHIVNEKNGLMNALDKVVKDKKAILIERDKILRESKINSELKIMSLKKRMMNAVNETQEKVNELNMKYVDFKTKLTLLQYQQEMLKYQHQSKLLSELTKKNKILETENFELRRELEIHKGVELSLADKYKKLKENNDVKNANLTMNNNNNFRKTENNSLDRKNKIMLNMHKKILNLENELILKQNDYEEEKNKIDSIKKVLKENKKRNLGIYNYLEECLKLFFNDDYLKSKKSIYIHIESLKKGDFEKLSKEEKYATLVILMRYLSPLILPNDNNELDNIQTRFNFIKSKNNNRFLIENNIDRKKGTNFFRKILRKKIIKKKDKNLELPYNFSFNSCDNDHCLSERTSFINSKKYDDK